MSKITSLDDLETLYGPPRPGSLKKVTPVLTPLYQDWIAASRFVVVATVAPEGTDASPRGDDGPVVRIIDETTLWLPDWMGNNRTDTLRNLVVDGRCSLMFMIPGCTNVVRVNGTAEVRTDDAMTASFERSGKRPRTVIAFRVEEAYFQCAKAIMRARLWSGEDESARVPTAGGFLKEQKAIEEDAAAYDASYADHAKGRMW